MTLTLVLTWVSLLAQPIKNLPAMLETEETQVQSLVWEDPLEEGMVTHSSVLAWRIPSADYSPKGHKESDTSEQLHIQARHNAISLVMILNQSLSDNNYYLRSGKISKEKIKLKAQEWHALFHFLFWEMNKETCSLFSTTEQLTSIIKLMVLSKWRDRKNLNPWLCCWTAGSTNSDRLFQGCKPISVLTFEASLSWVFSYLHVKTS